MEISQNDGIQVSNSNFFHVFQCQTFTGFEFFLMPGKISKNQRKRGLECRWMRDSSVAHHPQVLLYKNGNMHGYIVLMLIASLLKLLHEILKVFFLDH